MEDINLDFIIENNSIKDNFLKILNSYINRPITHALMYQMKNQLDSFFEANDLEGFSYALIKNKELNSIDLKPTNILNKYVLKGILTS